MSFILTFSVQQIIKTFSANLFCKMTMVMVGLRINWPLNCKLNYQWLTARLKC